MTPEGEIVKQSPEAGIEVEVGRPVDITVSSGSSQVKVPDLTGQSSFKARNMLTAAGLKLGDQIKTPNNDVPEGTIVKQYPAAGTKAKWGSHVSIRFSSGPEKITTSVPDISGKDLEEAERLLSSAGLALEGSITQKSRRLAGTVISTDPPAGAEVDVGTAVTSIVSSDPHVAPAKPSFLPGRQKSKPDFLPGKQKPKQPKLIKPQDLQDW